MHFSGHLYDIHRQVCHGSDRAYHVLRYGCGQAMSSMVDNHLMYYILSIPTNASVSANFILRGGNPMLSTNNVWWGGREGEGEGKDKQLKHGKMTTKIASVKNEESLFSKLRGILRYNMQRRLYLS